MGIYVEIPICGSIEELWEKTQNPALHERWDLRFSQIKYLPRAVGEAQKFLYRTRIGFGVKIDGEGESSGFKNDEASLYTGEAETNLKILRTRNQAQPQGWKEVQDKAANNLKIASYKLNVARTRCDAIVGSLGTV